MDQARQNAIPAETDASARPKPSRARRILRFAGWATVLAAVAVAAVVAVDRWMETDAQSRIYGNVDEVPPRETAIVFGAKVYPGGGLSIVLRERVDAAIELYRAGKVRKLLMTGDNGRADYDEVTAMKQYAVTWGVPAEDIVRDFAGFRTYDSCYRARDIFGVKGAVLVTQGFHLPRELYTARSLGIDAVGLEAEDGMPPASVRASRAREVLARTAAVIDGPLLRRKPRFLGPREPLFARNDPDR